jgi:hypothetical protein
MISDHHTKRVERDRKITILKEPESTGRTGGTLNCQVCRRLQAEYTLRHSLYETASAALARVEDRPTASYSSLRVASDDAGLGFRLATLELEKHLRVHLKAN